MPTSRDELTVATWNVEYGLGSRKNTAREQIFSQHPADVWILTETHDSLRPIGDFESFSTGQRTGGGQLSSGSRWVTIWASTSLSPKKLETSNNSRTAACVVQTDIGPLTIFGTVLPWYGDSETVSFVDELVRQAHDWNRLAGEQQSALCVAGDFNVNVGGPHYYGSKENKIALTTTLSNSGLCLLTEYPQAQQADIDFGLIDHIAISKGFAKRHEKPIVWGRRDDNGLKLSDHCGVAVTFSLRYFG
jgi:endonuclease/exonuclease/phosphatase family metal-dependent hydrolase